MWAIYNLLETMVLVAALFAVLYVGIPKDLK